MLVRGVEPDSPVDFVIEDALSVPSLRVRDLETIGIGEYESRIPLREGEAPRVAVVPMADGGSPDLVIFDRCTPASMPACPSVSFGGSLPIPGLNLSSPTAGESRVTFYRRTHPIMRYTDMGDLSISRRARHHAPGRFGRDDDVAGARGRGGGHARRGVAP